MEIFLPGFFHLYSCKPLPHTLWDWNLVAGQQLEKLTKSILCLPAFCRQHSGTDKMRTRSPKVCEKFPPPIFTINTCVKSHALTVPPDYLFLLYHRSKEESHGNPLSVPLVDLQINLLCLYNNHQKNLIITQFLWFSSSRTAIWLWISMVEGSNERP